MSDDWALVIDYREIGLIECLQNAKVPYRSDNLAVGDIQLQHKGIPLLIIERKTVSDLEASICDGRYREQKLRLLSTKKTHTRLAYLIEGDIRTATRIPVSNLYGAITGLWIRDGIQVIQSSDLADTSFIVQKLFSRRELLCNNKTDDGTDVSYGACAPISRRRDASSRDIYLLMLRQVPGVSGRIATAICTSYPNMSLLLATSKDDLHDDSSKFVDRVANIKYDTKKGSRRVGKAVASRLCTMLGMGPQTPQV